jgi:hypothetical protein
MANTTPPIINKNKNKKTATGQVNGVKQKSNIQNISPTTSNNSTVFTSTDIYPYGSQLQNKNPYKNYDINNMFQEQSAKQTKPALRFTLVCNGFKFQGHIDPNHLIDNQSKRLVQIDTLTGIVLQDFGYMMQNLELRGTTGSAYYLEIQRMDAVFNNQSTGGSATASNPTPCVLTIEGRTYSGVWKDFSFERQAQENTYKYTIVFDVMTKGKYSNNGTSSNFNSTQTQKNQITNGLTSSNGKAQVNYVNYPGNTPRQYANSIFQFYKVGSTAQILQYLKNNWSSAPQNANSAYPGDDGKLSTTQVLVTPLNWNTVLK